MSDSNPPDSAEKNASPADIIAYIGIPLAVLGVIPIFYTFINSLVTAFNIRRKLRRNAVTTGVTRSSVLSGIIECEFPRFSLTPPDRDDPDYWTLNPHPTRLKGGSWTIFNWNKLATGRKMYRVQFSSDMQVPQADINFEELLAFLVDRGARPDPKGWRLLNMAGLWTPANTSLLLSADSKESVLRVAFPEDSDGILSLALQWRVGWENANAEDGLPPHWMKLKDGRLPRSEAKIVLEDEKLVEDVEAKEASGTGTEMGEKEPAVESVQRAQNSDTTADIGTKFPSAVTIHLSMKSSVPFIDNIQSVAHPSSHRPSMINSNSYISQGLSSTWLAVLATALGTLQGASIYTIHLPEDFSLLAAKDTLPCGVLVTSGILEETESPSWETKYDLNEDAREFHARHVRQSAEMRAESQLPPAQRAAATRLREERHRQDFHQQSMQRMYRDKERRERREREALESTHLSTEIAAQAALRKLSKVERHERGIEIPAADQASLLRPWTDVKSAAETILFMMLTEEQVGKGVGAVLEKWKAWTDRGGMNKEDLDLVCGGGEAWRWFAYAVISMALLKEEGQNKESTLALDLQDCVRTWKRVRLG